MQSFEKGEGGCYSRNGDVVMTDYSGVSKYVMLFE